MVIQNGFIGAKILEQDEYLISNLIIIMKLKKLKNYNF